MAQEPRQVWTIGHSTRSLEEFAALLAEHGIVTVADIRRFPGSRRYPHFTSPLFGELLRERNVAYLHVPELGGRRRGKPDSPNTAWKNASFRAYADHMATAEFHRGIEAVLAAASPVALLCAEAVPWRCHRQLVSDELFRRGLRVTHILAPAATREHKLTAFAVIRPCHVAYPAHPLLDTDSLR